MLGFLRSRGCARHYCGVCKTIGADYGHPSRLLLNHDVVLVAEIMTALNPGEAAHPVLRRRNCFRLPDKGAAPLALRYAAAATVLLASAKLRDHVLDTGRARWRLLERALRPRYRTAADRLKAWGVPVGRIEAELASQLRREAAPESLDQLAEPTAFATAEVCRSAANAAGRADAAPALARFGHSFGSLIYLLDAWHDLDRDTASGQFNAVRALYGTAESARPALDAAAREVERSIGELPLGEAPRAALRARFEANLTFATSPKKEAKNRLAACMPDCAPDCCDSCCDCDCCCDSCDVCGACDC